MRELLEAIQKARDFALSVEDRKGHAMDHIKFLFKKFYYQLTAYIPRLMPRNEDGFRKLQRDLREYFDIEDREDIWLTLCGQISSVPATKMRKSYKSLVNACLRLDVNRTAREIKTLYITQLENKLKEATQKMVDNEVKAQVIRPEEPPDTALPIGSLDFQRDLQVM